MSNSTQQTPCISTATPTIISTDELGQISGGLCLRIGATDTKYALLNGPAVTPNIGEIITMADHEHGGKFALML